MSEFSGYVGPCEIRPGQGYFDLMDAQGQFICRKSDRARLEWLKRVIDGQTSPIKGEPSKT